MRRETVRIEIYPDQLFTDRQEAERSYAFYSGLHSSLAGLLPKLKEIRSEYLNWKKPVRAGCLLLLLNPVSDCLTFFGGVALIVVAVMTYKTNPTLTVIMVVTFLVILIAAAVGGAFLTVAAFHVLRSQWYTLRMISRIQKLPTPELKLEKTESSEAQDEVYRVKGIFEILDGSRERISVEKMIEIWSSIDIKVASLKASEGKGA